MDFFIPETHYRMSINACLNRLLTFVWGMPFILGKLLLSEIK